MLEFQEDEVELEEMVHLDSLVPMVILVSKEFLEVQVPQAHKDLRDNVVTVVILARPEIKGLLVAQVIQGKSEDKEIEDHQVHKGNLVNQGNRELG